MPRAKKEFGYYVASFLSDYLPSVKGCSSRTVASYRDTLVMFIEFMSAGKRGSIVLADISYEAVRSFLEHLESERGNSIATRNQRQAAMCSFLSYVRAREPEMYGQISDALALPRKKAEKPTIAYLTVEEIETLFSSIDDGDPAGLRDKAMIAFLYETAARVSEMTGCLVRQLHFGSSPYVELRGKGGKTRNVPTTDSFVNLIGNYAEAFGVSSGDAHLFTNRYGQPLTQKGAAYVLGKHLAIASEAKPSIAAKHITCHCLRHSRAMHLLEAGVNLIYIRDILGHASVTTTEIYARTNPEIKRKYLAEHSASYSVGEKFSEDEKDDLVKWLKNNF